MTEEGTHKTATDAPSRGAREAVSLGMAIDRAPGVGASRARAFREMGITTVGDLLHHYPFRVEAEHGEDSIAAHTAEIAARPDAEKSANIAVRGTVAASRTAFGKRPRLEATLDDGTGTVRLVFFNMPWLRGKLHPGRQGIVEGKAKLERGYLEIVNGKWTDVSADPAGAVARSDRLRPVYPSTEALPSRVIEQTVRGLLDAACEAIPEILPDEFLQSRGLAGIREAVRGMHAPASEAAFGAARTRLAYDELLCLQLAVAIKRRMRAAQGAPALPMPAATEREILARFPFEFTPDQAATFREIAQDLSETRPMNRLLQGDVGAGKTAVALASMLVAVANRHQAALMAPTELLAEQHFASISRFLAGTSVRVALLTGSLSASERARVRDLCEMGAVDIVVGTHALLTGDVRFHALALAVVDEQHRFGVAQRAELRGKAPAGQTPHMLVMTATPIPRTLSLTVYGDLDVSTIRHRPKDRSPVRTRVLPEARADEAYAFVAERIARGEQAFIVVPAVEESDLGLKDVAGHLERLASGPLAGARLAAMHGRMKPEERDGIMDRFRTGEIDALVATVVIEVGVDVPNATVMVIEHADRFGLAQLHQLRGRVGRGPKGGVCVLVADPVTDDGRARLEAIRSTDDGFRISELDLAIRGPGELFGARQSGLPPFKVADLTRDLGLLERARRDATEWIARSPILAQDGEHLLRRKVLGTYGEALGLGDVG
ncbi:MAG: ATP-dependent DNA helicase RecG [Planctomycetota bacterium]